MLLRNQNGGLIITHLDSEDSIIVEQQFDDATFSKKESISHITFDDGTDWDLAAIHALSIKGTDQDDNIETISETDIIYAGKGNDYIFSHSLANQIYGEAGNDAIEGTGKFFGQEGNDTLAGAGELYGGIGDDNLILEEQFDYSPSFDEQSLIKTILDGGAGNDVLDASNTSMPFGSDNVGFIIPDTGESVYTLRGGKGNDTIYGSFDNDVYEFSLGDGQDIIIETKADQAFSNVAASYDVIRFDESIAVDDIYIKRVGNDMILQHVNGSDQITVKEHFNTYNSAAAHYKINAIEFNDGTKLSLDDINNQAVWSGTNNADQMIGDNDNNTIYAGEGDDKIFVQGGDDTVYGEAGNDYIVGDAGNDKLYGGLGNDQLTGGTGNDTLDGGQGNDNYIYSLGDGQDIIDQTGGGRDILFFINGITKDRLSFSKDNNDLVIIIDNDENQSVRVKEHFLGGEKAITMVQPDGGYAITADVIAQMVNASNPDDGTTLDPTTIDGDNAANQLMGTNSGDHLRGKGGNDQLFGMAGDDTLDGGSDNDYLSGGNGSGTNSGDDTLIGGAGNDTLLGEDGNDLLLGGTGDDKYIYTENSGIDTIDNTGGGMDGIFFNGIASNRLSFHRDQNDLVILVDESLDQQIRVKDHFLGADKAISYVQPANGYSLTSSQINAMLVAMPDDNDIPSDSPKDNDEQGQTLTGTVGNDTLQGGSGNDILNGGTGDDTYIYTAGADVINESGGIDKLIFANNITFSQVGSYLLKSGDDLILRVNGSDENSVKLKNYFRGGDNIVETIAFQTGGSISAQQLFDAFGVKMPTENAEVNKIIGTTGNDRIESTSANETLIGDKGDDTYIFRPRFGQDTIDNTGGGNDRILFDDGISFQDIASNIIKSGNDLVLNTTGTTDELTVTDWFLDNENTIETIDFNSGGQLTADQIFDLYGISRSSNRVASFAMARSSDISAATNANKMVEAMAAFGTGENLDHLQTPDLTQPNMLVASGVSKPLV